MSDSKEQMRDYSNPPGDGWTWYSICSAHFETNIDCDACMSGKWENDEEQALDRELFEKDYDAWVVKHNIHYSESRTFLNKVFPNLK